ncbi:MAG TPA: hypothetical protein VLH13_04310, partial [Methanomassiliicoccales archaeon]|nr:hypothetical protein [Methanomassiliicoccales archaeon]
ELIMALRGEAADEGNVPKAFKEEAKLFQRTGLSFPSTGLTKKLRKDMGLKDLVTEPQTVEELTVIIKATRLGRLDLE